MNDVIRMIRKWLRPYQEFVLPVILLGVSSLVILVGVIPGVRKTYQQWNQLAAERGEVTELREKAAFLASLNETTLFDQLSSLTSAMPIDKSIPSIFSTIDGVSAKTGSIFSSMQLASPGSIATEAAKRQTTEEAALGSYLIPFTLTMEGSYSQLRDTFDTLTTSRRLLRIKNVTVSFTTESLGRATLSMDTFWAPLSKSSLGKKLVPLTGKEDSLISRVGNLPLLSAVGVASGVPVVPRPDPFSP
ncbi:hypothetical protein HYV22_00755 [Candidatus Gottesmanbacteria bacterium]|nr:hypothetical protein [Candidatus Gottesmanbacteria bacterium]